MKWRTRIWSISAIASIIDKVCSELLTDDKVRIAEWINKFLQWAK